MLDQPLTLPNGALLPNRIAKAAMSEGLADRHGRATPLLVRLYQRFGESGAGLLISGNVMVDGRALEHPGNVVLDDAADAEALAALTRMVAAARARGALFLAQISHPGRQVQRFVARTPVAPSAVAPVRMMGAFGRPRALEPDEIPALVDAFARTAERAERAGANGVQIHAAHGYLVNQFLSPLTNRRTDGWGGPLAARARFLLEIVRAVRARTAPGFIISVKLNSADFQRGGFDEDDALEVVRMLDAERVDLLEISGGTYEAARMMGARGVDAAPVRASTRAREAYFLDFARRVRAVSRMPLMVTGGFRSRAAMEEALAEGALDVIGMARPLAVEPDLPARLLSGAAERSTVRPRRTISRRLDLMAEGGWHALQLRRMAEGREPDPLLSPTWAALRFSVGQMVRALRLPRRPALAPPRALPALDGGTGS
jgi:2,4-dienoyl-CoA reductase-like NADH-dependent reductase (Old Yellow Enzyme family)